MIPTQPPVDGTVARATPAVELYVRSLAPGEATAEQEAVLERLDELAARDRVASYDVHVWGDRIAPDSVAARTRPGQFARDRVAAFRSWAHRNDASLAPALATQALHSTFTGEDHETVRFPTMVLAEFVDGELDHVAPCTRADTHWSVRDRLDALEHRSAVTADTTGVPVSRPPSKSPAPLEEAAEE